MGVIAKEVKAMSQNEILEFEKVGELTIMMHCLKLTDIKVRREFKRPDALTEKEMDAAGDGDVLVVLDLRPDESLFEAGFAREVVNRIQKLRKKLALDPTDAVDVYIESLKENSTLQRVLDSQELYIRDAIGSQLLPSTAMPSHAVVIGNEAFHGISGLSFSISLARAAVMINSESCAALYGGNTRFCQMLQVYLVSRDHSNLKIEVQLGNGTIRVDSIENLPPVELELGRHFHLTVGDHFVATRMQLG